MANIYNENETWNHLFENSQALKIFRIRHMGGSHFNYCSKLVAWTCTFNVRDERHNIWAQGFVVILSFITHENSVCDMR